MLEEVIVDRNAFGIVEGVQPFGLDVVDDMVPLLEEKDVGRDFGPGICFEGGVGKPDGPQELSSLRDILPNLFSH